MKTSKTFMCTAFETDVMYVKTMLDLLMKSGDISLYAFVVHNGTEKVKPHIHVYVDPGKEIDIRFLLAMLNAKSFAHIDWCTWGHGFESDEVVCIGIQSEFTHYLEV